MVDEPSGVVRHGDCCQAKSMSLPEGRAPRIIASEKKAYRQLKHQDSDASRLPQFYMTKIGGRRPAHGCASSSS
jgi:hypothetical protein